MGPGLDLCLLDIQGLVPPRPLPTSICPQPSCPLVSSPHLGLECQASVPEPQEMWTTVLAVLSRCSVVARLKDGAQHPGTS